MTATSSSVRRRRRKPFSMIIRRLRKRGSSLSTEKRFPYLDQLAWAELATNCGLPATVIPLRVADGLPSGVQIIGPHLEDRTPLAFARAIEREFGGFVPPPGYASGVRDVGRAMRG